LDALRFKGAALEEELKALESEKEARATAAARDRAELGRLRGANAARDTKKKGSERHAR